jgi:hypothetical protein
MEEQPEPVYHWYEYGVVPPEPAEAVSVTVCPESIEGLDGEMIGVAKAGFMVIVLLGEYPVFAPS